MVLVIIWRTARPLWVLYGNSASATGGESILVIIVWQRRRPRSLRWPAPRKRLHHGYHVSGDQQDCSHIKSANLKFYQKCYFYFTNSTEFLIHNFKLFLFPWALICQHLVCCIRNKCYQCSSLFPLFLHRSYHFCRCLIHVSKHGYPGPIHIVTTHYYTAGLINFRVFQLNFSSLSWLIG